MVSIADISQWWVQGSPKFITWVKSNYQLNFSNSYEKINLIVWFLLFVFYIRNILMLLKQRKTRWEYTINYFKRWERRGRLYVRLFTLSTTKIKHLKSFIEFSWWGHYHTCSKNSAVFQFTQRFYITIFLNILKGLTNL